jgi:hypothetical protein
MLDDFEDPALLEGAQPIRILQSVLVKLQKLAEQARRLASA